MKNIKQQDRAILNINSSAPKFKIALLAASITTLICSSVTSYSADLEIYKIPEDSVGATTLMMMLDLSGSMGYGSGYGGSDSMSIEEDYGVCVNQRSQIKSDSTTTELYKRYYCAVDKNTTNKRVTGYWYPDELAVNKQWVAGCEVQTDRSYRCYDRLTRLKDGLRQVLEGTPTVKKVDDKIIIGLATFAGSNGYIRIPSRALGAPSGETKRVQVTKTRVVQKERDVYGDVEEEYVITPGTPPTDPVYGPDVVVTPAYKKVYYIRQVSWGLDYEYKMCTEWSTSNPECNKYSNNWSNNNNRLNQVRKVNEDYPDLRSESCGFNCTRFYVQVPAVTKPGILIRPGSPGTPDVMGTRTVRKVIGKETYEDVETYTEWEHQDVSQREVILNSLKDLNANDGTPTPYAYAEAAAYLMGTNTHGGATHNISNYSGWSSSTYLAKTDPTSSAVNYAAPISITSQKDNQAKRECSGQGIYFLTDGQPQPNGTAPGADGKSGTAYTLMSRALGTKGSTFDCLNSPLGQRGNYAYPENGWSCVGKLAQALLDPAKNPTSLKIQTAVVGFGSSFGAGASSTDDVRDAKDWGVLGGGGWISGSSPEDVAKSINDFISQLNKDIPSMSTGSSTIPTDALNPEIIQPYSYFPQFEPKVNASDLQQLWLGNLKKFYVVNGGVYSNPNPSNNSTVVLKSKLQDLTDIWAKSGVDYPENTPIFKKGGILSQLSIGLEAQVDGQYKTSRKLLTDYTFDGTKNPNESISRNYDLNKVDHTYISDPKTKTDSTLRQRGLMALLGYEISNNTDLDRLDLTSTAPNLRQMGSIYHSLPVLITQEGKAVAERNVTTGKVQISSVGRKDYVMFGTTQGLLAVVDAGTGVEIFSFVPTEMIEKQAETFRADGGALRNGKEALYYGLDGEWVAHTVYVTKEDGTLTVKGASRSTGEASNSNFDGKQWVYGGMRMGGRSYYSLDLTDIDNPKLKFHIDPTTGRVYSKAHPNGKVFDAIKNMAQSWSKPKLDYVNWKGERKLVMFVGGGYDAGGDHGDGLWVDGIRTGYAGYEKYNYKQANKKGSGVYMFDAATGDLLWYANSDTAGTNSVAHLNHADLKYSVASEIKTIDRNNDGMVDHIYFGDLAGQAFRIDFDRSVDSFNSQISKVLDLHQSNGTSPRFYLPPVFTAHHSAHRKEGANVVVATFVSGNKSSPLLATIDSSTTTGVQSPLGLQYDAVYAVYDYDIHPNGQFYPNSNKGARSLAQSGESVAQNKLKLITNVVRSDSDDALVKGALADSNSGWGGWYYQFDKKFDGSSALQSIVKGLSPLVAMEGSLYVTMFDASNNGTTSSCGAGVKGHSFTQRLCLPTGVCPENANYKYNLGAGIVSLNVGSVDGSNIKSIVVPDPEDIGETPCVGTDCKAGQKFISAGGSIRFIPNRWFERYAKMD